jgi:hypothetical protein
VSRATELARLAIRRHETTGIALEQAIADAIRGALREQLGADATPASRRASADVVALLQKRTQLTPDLIARYRGTKPDAARRLVLRMLAEGILRRLRRGVYVLGPDWRRRVGLNRGAA